MPVELEETCKRLQIEHDIDVIHEWDDITGRIGIQFHTPFVDNDPLWLPIGEERNRAIDSILDYSCNENKRFVINSKEQFELMRAIGDTNVPTG